MTGSLTTSPPGPVHMVGGPRGRWTTVNLSEAIPGVIAPLTWSFWGDGMEAGGRRGFAAMGALTRSEVGLPTSPDERITGVFFGRPAGNIDMFRKFGDYMPGASGDEVEEGLFGAPPEGGGIPGPRRPYLRYALTVAKLPRAALAPRRMPAMREEYRAWWQRSVLDSPPQDRPAARRLWAESFERFSMAMTPHTITTMFGGAVLDSLSDLAQEAVGDRGLASSLATGYGAMEETELIEDLWATSTGELPVSEVVRRHGYHGPHEGDMRTLAWREDPAPLEAIVANYRSSAVASPREREHEQAAKRDAAEKRLLAGLASPKRPLARLAIRLGRFYIPKRELGKATFLHALDGGRCAARVAGATLADEGVLEDPEDVFFLTAEEVFGPRGDSVRELVAERKELHADYERHDLPQVFTGQPRRIELKPPSAESGAVRELHGIGITGDLVRGRARVVHDPATAQLEPGDILVCATTDPSWTPLFMVADALVIDKGGAMSHGAIVARELGVPCVINTVTGTRDIPDGAPITVDPAAGAVLVDEPDRAPA